MKPEKKNYVSTGFEHTNWARAHFKHYATAVPSWSNYSTTGALPGFRSRI